MAVYVVSYDLTSEENDYNGLAEALQQFVYCKHLDSTWLIATDLTSEKIWDIFSPHLDPRDHMLIIQVTNDYFGKLPEEAWEWLKQYSL